MSKFAFRIFEEKCTNILNAHGLEVPSSAMRFSEGAIDAAGNGDWNPLSGVSANGTDLRL